MCSNFIAPKFYNYYVTMSCLGLISIHIHKFILCHIHPETIKFKIAPKKLKSYFKNNFSYKYIFFLQLRF